MERIYWNSWYYCWYYIEENLSITILHISWLLPIHRPQKVTRVEPQAQIKSRKRYENPFSQDRVTSPWIRRVHLIVDIRTTSSIFATSVPSCCLKPSTNSNNDLIFVTSVLHYCESFMKLEQRNLVTFPVMPSWNSKNDSSSEISKTCCESFWYSGRCLELLLLPCNPYVWTIIIAISHGIQ